ncbi:MAG TPA: magnesium/cobalt efflux protein, partial [Xanthobacteraceae bacterium]|nr:magnesium/cobalt efflux protein [Xanthobacteraceae bacterium]
PVRGELVAGPGNFEIEVFDADPRRLKRLRIYRRKSAPPADGKRRSVRAEAAAPAPAVGETSAAKPEANVGDVNSPGGAH